MSHSISLRLGSDADARAIAEIESSSLADVLTLLGKRAPRAEALVGLSSWEERLRIAHGDDHFVHVAFDETETLTGFVAGGGSRDGDTRGFGELFTLHVDPIHRGRGIGSALLDAAISSLSNARFLAASLWIPHDLRNSNAFLLKREFVTDSVRKTMPLGGFELDFERLRRPLEL